MTKRLNRILLTVQVLFIIALAVFYYFNHNKMGMMRWTVYQNYFIEKENMHYLLFAFSSVFTILSIYSIYRKNIGILPIYIIVYIVNWIFKNTIFKHDFYFILIIISLCLAIELVRMYLNSVYYKKYL